MKRKVLIMAAALFGAALISVPEASAQFAGGPGPAIAGSATQSQLPQGARKFIEKHYGHTSIAKIEREFGPGTYEVELRDGTDIEFDSKGNVVEIDAPDRGRALPKDVVKAILPHKAYKKLESAGQVSHVDEIELEYGSVYVIKTRAVKKMKYGYDVNEDTWVMY